MKVKKKPEKIGKIRLRDGVAFRIIEGEAAVLRPDDGTLMILNETGSFILNNIRKGMLIDTLIKKVVDEYDTTLKKAEKDVKSFLKILEKESIVEIS